jgi:hypothetical protein
VCTCGRQYCKCQFTQSFVRSSRKALKVDSNEKCQKDGNVWVLVWDCGDRWLFATVFEHAVFFVKSLLLFPLATALLTGVV